jgi:hypothetical protein
MTLFYINAEYESDTRFDSAKFMEFINGNYDILNSYLFNRIKELPLSGVYKVVSEDANPPLVSFRIYQDIQYWYLLLLYNDVIDFRDVKIGDRIKFFDLSDLEDLFFVLRTRQAQLEIEQAQESLSSSTIINGDTQLIGNFVTSLTAPDNPLDLWRKEGTNTNFVFDDTRGKWLSTHILDKGSAKAFGSVGSQYLLSDGVYTNEVPLSMPFDGTIVQIIIKTKQAAQFDIEIRDTNGDLVEGGKISVDSELTLNNESLDIDLDKDAEFSVYLNDTGGTGVDNPKVTVFYKERG